MNTLQAIRDCVRAMEMKNFQGVKTTKCGYWFYGGTDIKHIRSMLERIEDDPQDFSIGKINRWLGYIQGVMVSSGKFTLDDIKYINKQYAD